MVDHSRTQRSQSLAIGGVRILAGLLWLANLHWKVPGDFGKTGGGGLYKYTAAGAANAPFAPFRWMLREFVLPHFALFGWFTLISETIVAALLLIGYRTRIVALLGAALTLPIMLSVIYYPKADEWAWSYLLMIGVHLLLWATGAGDHLGLDGVLARDEVAAKSALRTIGIVTVVIGLLGLFVARSVDFAGRAAALLGSDAGFVESGKTVRRWELKFLWFNPLLAVLTIALGVALYFGAKKAVVALGAAAGLALLALIVLAQKTFDYLRDDGSIQRVSTASNVALWAGLAVAAALLGRRAMRSGPPSEA